MCGCVVAMIMSWVVTWLRDGCDFGDLVICVMLVTMLVTILVTCS